jgi:DNA-binding response OmpR family regulator
LKGRVFVVNWKSSETSKYKKELKKEGWVVEAESKNVMRAFERIKRNQPDAVVIYLNRSPKRGREVGFTLKSINMTKRLPVVFVTGLDSKKKRTKKVVPKALFSTSKELPRTLEKFSHDDN